MTRSLFALGQAVALAACAPQRTVYVGGRVLTLDTQDRVVEAVGVASDRIAAVGTAAEVRAWAGDGVFAHLRHLRISFFRSRLVAPPVACVARIDLRRGWS